MTESEVSERLRESNKQIARLDPLLLDDVLISLPVLNAAKDVNTLYSAAMAGIACAAENCDGYSNLEATAALRDLDFLLSSLVRHQPEIVGSIPDLDATLVALATLADSVPRGTVYTYAVANPEGSRRRSFTGSPEEELFIEAVASGANALDDSLLEIAATPMCNDGRLAVSLNHTSRSIDTMIDSIITVKRHLSPEFFTNEMRPYFEPLTINGIEYTGAGGAQLQFVALDFMLWGCDDDDAFYQGYVAENWQYLSPVQRLAAEKFASEYGGSIVSYVASTSDGTQGEETLRSSTADVLRKLRKFRYPHRKVAQDNFNVRPDDTLGSGAYTTNILDVLIVKTEEAMKKVEG